VPDPHNDKAASSFPPLAWLLAPFAFGYFCSYYFRSINAVAGPVLASEFGLGPQELGLLTGVYFLTFAAAQLPIGIALDRYGPSRVNLVLLSLIALGAIIFSLAPNLTVLTIGRAFIGAGAAGMLMSCMSAVPMWAPEKRVATYMGFATAVGGTGSIVAATPVQLAIDVVGWRPVFVAGGVFAFLMGVGAWATRRWSTPRAAGQSLRDLLGGVRTIYGTRRFWEIGFGAVFVLGTFLAFQSLWAATYSRDVAGLDRITTGNVLIALNAGMVAGFFTCGLISDALSARGVAPLTTVKLMILVALGAQVWLLAAPAFLPHLAWALYSFGANSLLLIFPVVQRVFTGALIGRVNTSLNLFCFGAAFVMQWAIGAWLNTFPVIEGRYAVAGYYQAWTVLFALQVVVFAWMHWTTRDGVVAPPTTAPPPRP